MDRERVRHRGGQVGGGAAGVLRRGRAPERPAGKESQLTGDLVADNAYALVCLTEDEKGEPLTLYVATPLVPSG